MKRSIGQRFYLRCPFFSATWITPWWLDVVPVLSTVSPASIETDELSAALRDAKGSRCKFLYVLTFL